LVLATSRQCALSHGPEGVFRRRLRPCFTTFFPPARTSSSSAAGTKVALRLAPKPTPAELEHGIPLFLDQLIRTLQIEQTADPLRSRRISGDSDGAPVLSEISASAALHGSELLNQGYSVDQVVHDYGDLCQAVTELAFEHGVPIAVDEFRTLNRCLDNAIADAVTEFAYQRDLGLAHVVARAHTERLGNLAHEMRNLIHTATLAVSALKPATSA
jgi:signal transduction histidine kinase